MEENPNLPAVFISGAIDRAIMEIDLKHLSSRLNYILEIVEQIDEAASSALTHVALQEFLSAIELDVSVNLSKPFNGDGGSLWLVHDSWTFDTSPKVMLEGICSPVRAHLSASLPTVDVDAEGAMKWISLESSVIRKTYESFFTAESYSAALANLITIDVLLSRLFAALTIMRLSISIWGKEDAIGAS